MILMFDFAWLPTGKSKVFRKTTVGILNYQSHRLFVNLFIVQAIELVTDATQKWRVLFSKIGIIS